MTNYIFHEGQRVRSKDYWNKTGEITCMVPGDGRTPWYFVLWDDGSEDRYTAEELESEI
jgi:hypothetical protein